MIHERDGLAIASPSPSTATAPPTPHSPPDMTTSKSSKSSSFISSRYDETSAIDDIGNFEDIGLDDDNVTVRSSSQLSLQKTPSSTASASRTLAAPPSSNGQRSPKPRASFPNLRTGNGPTSPNPRSTSLAVLADPRPLARPAGPGRGLSKTHSTTSLPMARRHRSPSPGLSPNPQDPRLGPKPRSGSWQGRDRRSLPELEDVYDEEEGGDDIPDGLFLDNVPLSPRPQQDRPPSRAPSVSPSRDRSPKDRVRSVGNGTPPVAQAQGSLKSPTWKTDNGRAPPSPLKTRTQSWNAAHAYLSAETRALTSKLEEYADEVEVQQNRRPSASGRPNTWNSSQMPNGYSYDKKERIKSTPELPPLRRTNVMIDPLPVSKEKEAVLSRTRPSWLPPKDPAEERRHLKEYQKMMAASAKTDERREAARRTKLDSKDSVADGSQQVWENEVLPRWDDALRERRTREMWWRGIPPRSRGKIWTRAIGNELGLTKESFVAALKRGHELEARVSAEKGTAEDNKRVAWLSTIRDDVANHTWRDLRIFEDGGPLHEGLIDVLMAYAMYRNDIGYVSGCNVSNDDALKCLTLGKLTRSRPSPHCCSSTFPALTKLSSLSPIFSTDRSPCRFIPRTLERRARPTTSSSRLWRQSRWICTTT